MSKKPTVLMILDGYGMSDKVEGNAIAQAKTRLWTNLWQNVRLYWDRQVVWPLDFRKDRWEIRK